MTTSISSSKLQNSSPTANKAATSATPKPGRACNATAARKQYPYGMYTLSKLWGPGKWVAVKPDPWAIRELKNQIANIYGALYFQKIDIKKRRFRWQTTEYLQCESGKWRKHSYMYEFVEYNYDSSFTLANAVRKVQRNQYSKPIRTQKFKRLY